MKKLKTTLLALLSSFYCGSFFFLFHPHIAPPLFPSPSILLISPLMLDASFLIRLTPLGVVVGPGLSLYLPITFGKEKHIEWPHANNECWNRTRGGITQYSLSYSCFISHLVIISFRLPPSDTPSEVISASVKPICDFVLFLFRTQTHAFWVFL